MEQPRVEALLQPNRQVMLAHVEHLFGGWLQGCQDGLVELAWTETTPNAAGRYALNRAELFPTDRLEDLVDMAVRLNATPMCNVYIGAALRKQKTPRFGRSDRSDILALPALYADLDDAEAVANARHVYGDAKPTLVVLTGMVPHSRAQLWWRLDEPLFEAWSDRLEGIEKALGGDAVSNSDRVMRLAGSVAWPVKPDRVAELTAIVPLSQPGLSEYMPEHLAQVFPFTPVRERDEKGSAPPPGTGSGSNAFGFASDLIEDHRESYMRDTVLAVLLQWIGENGAAPTAEELFEAVWPQYSRKVDFTRPGRRADEVIEKCRYTLKRFADGELRGLRTLDEAIATWKRKQAAREGAPEGARRERKERKEWAGEPPPSSDPSKPLILTAAEFIAGFTPPEYLVDGIIQRGYLYSLTARTGHGKTAVSMYLAQAVARGLAIQGREVAQGHVLFLAGENPDDIRARLLVLGDNQGFNPADIPLHFIPGVKKLADEMPRIQAEVAKIPSLKMVVVDTAQAYFPGDNSNDNAQVVAYARLLRSFTFLSGLPAVIVNSHPVKNAARDNLLPYGGGGYTNELDGNLILWSGVEGQTELHWQGKFRGPEFEPLTFKIETVTSDLVKDAKGRLMPSVVATPVGEMEIGFAKAASEADENKVLNAIAMNPKRSMAEIARVLGWVSKEGRPAKSKVQRAIMRLRDDKLIIKSRGERVVITAAGRKEIGLDD